MDMTLLTKDQLIGELTTWAGRVAAGEALVLRLLGELDEREAWAGHGVLSCANWASWRLGLTLPTAREKVRVARALRGLPQLAEQFGAGRLSYAQARAITRVATPADEARWLELAEFTTAAQLEKAVRGVARARGLRTPPDQPREAVRISWDEDGTLVVGLRISAFHAPAVLAALEQARATEQADRDRLYAQLAEDLISSDVSAETPTVPAPPYAEPYVYEEPPYPMPSQRASILEPRTTEEIAALAAWRAECDRRRARRDAARAWQDHVAAEATRQEMPAPRATLADGFVRALTRPTGGKPVTVKLLVDPVSGWARTTSDELLPPSTMRQMLKGLPRQGARTLSRHDLGRSNRVVSLTLREHLGQLDGERCRFPSCDRTTHLHAHHVRFWRDGGLTDLANLVLVCSRHHTLIHQQGFQLVLSPDRRLTVRTADDIPVPHLPALPVGDARDLDCSVAGLADGYVGDRFDLEYVVQIMAQHSS